MHISISKEVMEVKIALMQEFSRAPIFRSPVGAPLTLVAKQEPKGQHS